MIVAVCSHLQILEREQKRSIFILLFLEEVLY